jgi:hypothetical protein
VFTVNGAAMQQNYAKYVGNKIIIDFDDAKLAD